MMFVWTTIPLLIIFGILNLIIGVSNDAVNFLGPAIGSGVAKRRNIIFISALGILIGTYISAGMLEVAHHGIINTENLRTTEFFSVLLASLMVNIILIDTFNTLKFPTSTTIAVVFELTGGVLAIAMLKGINSSDNSIIQSVINTDVVFFILTGIILSIIAAFFIGVAVQFLTRLIFTFRYRNSNKILFSIFGGMAITAISFMILKKSLTGLMIGDTFWQELAVNYIPEMLITVFAGSTFLFFFMSLTFEIDVSRLVVLFGTFALALSFAANDLVNFVGIPVAGIETAYSTLSGSLSGYDGSFIQLIIYGLFAMIMAFTLFFSKKAKGVIETELFLMRQNPGYERFEAFPASVYVVDLFLKIKRNFLKVIPEGVVSYINKRYVNDLNELKINFQSEIVYFDNLRAIVTLTVAGLLISFGTYFRFPLSTTFVVFMVAIGTALADNAWKKENAAQRVSGTIYIMGGWFLTAAMAFLGTFILTIVLFVGKTFILIPVTLLLFYRLYKTNFFTGLNNDVKRITGNEDVNIMDQDEMLNDIDINFRYLLLECSKIYFLAVQSFLEEDKNSSVKVAKDANLLHERAERLKSGLFEVLIDLPESRIDYGNLLIQSFDHITGMLKNLTFIGGSLKKTNSRKGYRFIGSQRKEMHDLADEVSSFFNFMIHIIKEKRFNSIPELISKQQLIISHIGELRLIQIKRTKNRKGTARSGLLYLEIQASTRDLLLSSINFINTYRKAMTS